MGVRIMITCGCEDEHYSAELGYDDVELWLDNYRVLQNLGIATLPAVGAVDEEESNEEWTLVTIEPCAFLAWIETLAAQRSAISEAFRAAGKRWNDRSFWKLEPLLRALAAHSLSEGTHVSASFG